MRDGSGGCLRKRLKSSSVCRQGEGFAKVPQVKVPDTSTAVWVNTSMTRADCERECYKNCSCSAYASIKIPGKEVGCLAWYGDLMDIVDLTDHSGHDVHVRADAIELAEIARSNGFLEMKGMLAFLVVSVSSAWFASVIFAYLWLRKRKKRDPIRSSFLNWSKRFEIIVGIARGILYLHQDSRLRIIHKDLKSSNILLDSEMNPKISDFRMARILKGDQIQHKTHRVIETYGYMSPEYAMFGKFSIKSDVFSFGVILLEIISGKKSNGFHQEDPSLTLIGHVWELWKEGRALEMVDSTLKESYNSHEVMKCIRIALLCVQEDAMRPTISAIILMLDSEIDLPYPKQPAFIFRTSCSSSLIWEGRSSINEVTITETLAR
ncbi:hypothetical protein GH714_019365 [Hevea brasiliensis]|uniref:non-specific serine/threonine protein kinase n=1 Tax=Hevea brasiliensis TaxID=3981 RepID=A0A6A6LTW9_HEVBR|nr:hypothetical protein GH714_019365 [Hevea brasiliensis]